MRGHSSFGSGSVLRHFAATVVVAVLAACGGGDSAEMPAAVAETSTVITPAGGTVTGPDGVTITLPAGALDADTQIRIARYATGAPAWPKGWAAMSAVYLITPHIPFLSAQAEISIPFDASMAGGNAGELRIAMAQPGGEWTTIQGGTAKGGHAVARASHFSYVVVYASNWRAGTFTMALGPKPAVLTTAPSLSATLERRTAVYVTATFPKDAFASLDSFGNACVADVTVSLVKQSFVWKLDPYLRYYIRQDYKSETIKSATAPIGYALRFDFDSVPVVVGPEDAGRWVVVLVVATCASHNALTGQDGKIQEGTELANFKVSSAFYSSSYPQIVDQPQSISVVAGQSAHADFAVDAFSPFWLSERSDDGGASWHVWSYFNGRYYYSGNLDFSPTLNDNDAMFRFLVCNNESGFVSPYFPPANTHPCLYTNAFTLTVTAAPIAAAVSISPTSQSIEAGTAATLTVTAIGSPSPSVRIFQMAAAGDVEVKDCAKAASCTYTTPKLALAQSGLQFYATATQTGASGQAEPPVKSAIATVVVVVPGSMPAEAPWQADTVAAAGGTATFAIRNDGSLWSWGANNGGALGRGASANTPQRVDTLGGVRSVASGAWYAAALLGNGDVYAWGWGGNVGAAIGSATLDNPLPVKVAGLTSIRAIASRYSHTLALDGNGRVFGFGPQGSGALGPLLDPASDGVRRIDGLPVIRQVAAGEAHSLALAIDGTVWAWGANGQGQLGTGAAGGSQPVPQRVPGLADVVAIAASSFASFAVHRDGTVSSWGSSVVVGRAGVAESPARIAGLTGVVGIAAGNYNAFALDAGGAGYGWGDNAAGRVGVGTAAATVAIPTAMAAVPLLAQIGGGESVGLATAGDGRIFTWGGNANLQLDGTVRGDANAPIDTGFKR